MPLDMGVRPLLQEGVTSVMGCMQTLDLMIFNAVPGIGNPRLCDFILLLAAHPSCTCKTGITLRQTSLTANNDSIN